MAASVGPATWNEVLNNIEAALNEPPDSQNTTQVLDEFRNPELSSRVEELLSDWGPDSLLLDARVAMGKKNSLQERPYSVVVVDALPPWEDSSVVEVHALPLSKQLSKAPDHRKTRLRDNYRRLIHLCPNLVEAAAWVEEALVPTAICLFASTAEELVRYEAVPRSARELPVPDSVYRAIHEWHHTQLLMRLQAGEVFGRLLDEILANRMAPHRTHADGARLMEVVAMLCGRDIVGCLSNDVVDDGAVEEFYENLEGWLGSSHFLLLMAQAPPTYTDRKRKLIPWDRPVEPAFFKSLLSDQIARRGFEEVKSGMHELAPGFVARDAGVLKRESLASYLGYPVPELLDEPFADSREPEWPTAGASLVIATRAIPQVDIPRESPGDELEGAPNTVRQQQPTAAGTTRRRPQSEAATGYDPADCDESGRTNRDLNPGQGEKAAAVIPAETRQPSEDPRHLNAGARTRGVDEDREEQVATIVDSGQQPEQTPAAAKRIARRPSGRSMRPRHAPEQVGDGEPRDNQPRQGTRPQRQGRSARSALPRMPPPVTSDDPVPARETAVPDLEIPPAALPPAPAAPADIARTTEQTRGTL